MSEEQPSEEEVVEAVYAFAAEQMKDGASGPEVEAMLVERGLDEEAAASVVEDLSRMRSEALRSAGKRNMRYGALWCIVGTVVTIATYSAASGGGTYVVAWGAIGFGAIQFFRLGELESIPQCSNLVKRRSVEHENKVVSFSSRLHVGRSYTGKIILGI